MLIDFLEKVIIKLPLIAGEAEAENQMEEARKVVRHTNNITPHTAKTTRETVEKFDWAQGLLPRPRSLRFLPFGSHETAIEREKI